MKKKGKLKEAVRSLLNAVINFLKDLKKKIKEWISKHLGQNKNNDKVDKLYKDIDDTFDYIHAEAKKAADTIDETDGETDSPLEDFYDTCMNTVKQRHAEAKQFIKSCINNIYSPDEKVIKSDDEVEDEFDEILKDCKNDLDDLLK